MSSGRRESRRRPEPTKSDTTKSDRLSGGNGTKKKIDSREQPSSWDDPEGVREIKTNWALHPKYGRQYRDFIEEGDGHRYRQWDNEDGPKQLISHYASSGQVQPYSAPPYEITSSPYVAQQLGSSFGNLVIGSWPSETTSEAPDFSQSLDYTTLTLSPDRSNTAPATGQFQPPSALVPPTVHRSQPPSKLVPPTVHRSNSQPDTTREKEEQGEHKNKNWVEVLSPGADYNSKDIIRAWTLYDTGTEGKNMNYISFEFANKVKTLGYDSIRLGFNQVDINILGMKERVTERLELRIRGALNIVKEVFVYVLHNPNFKYDLLLGDHFINENNIIEWKSFHTEMDQKERSAEKQRQYDAWATSQRALLRSQGYSTASPPSPPVQPQDTSSQQTVYYQQNGSPYYPPSQGQRR